MYEAEAFVAEDNRSGDGQVSLLEMEIRSADSAIAAGDDEPAGRMGGNVEFSNGKRLAESLQHACATAQYRLLVHAGDIRCGNMSCMRLLVRQDDRPDSANVRAQ